jgi:glycosyltransferase involved in cell wall biosynthesis
MRLLFLNGADCEGGAAKAATRLLQGIRAQGAQASLQVQRKSGADPLVLGPESKFARIMALARPSLEEALLGISPRRMQGPFSASFLPDGLRPEVSQFAPDLVHLHWVARMMRLETLARLQRPLVWTLHDSWPFTGGCYLPEDCTRYRESCGSCPVLRSSREGDLSRRVWRRKEKAWRGLDLTLVAPSLWMAERAGSSSLLAGRRVEVIPNGIDAQLYKPLDKAQARDIFSLPQDKVLLLFGAKGGLDDRNKGFHLLREALRELSQGPMRDRIELLIFGSSRPETPQQLGFRTHYLGWLSDDVSLALLYSAADLFVFPSIQESLGYTAMEAMGCGTPCVAFRQGGVPDLISHEENGYLARPYQPADLARGISWVLESEERRRRLGSNARKIVSGQFSLETVAARHLTLYREVLGR